MDYNIHETKKGSHGQRSLAGYSPRGHKESNSTEQLTLTSLTGGGRTELVRRKKRRKTEALEGCLGKEPVTYQTCVEKETDIYAKEFKD